MTNIALIGYGKMGQTVRRFAEAKGHTITAVVDPIAGGDCHPEITAEILSGAEVCIDFTSPKTAVANIRQLAALGKNMVIGTTGWYNQMDEVKQIVAGAPGRPDLVGKLFDRRECPVPDRGKRRPDAQQFSGLRRVGPRISPQRQSRFTLRHGGHARQNPSSTTSTAKSGW